MIPVRLSVGSQPCHCNLDFHGTKLVALTGGPGAGKSAVLELARRSFCEHVAIMPEAASIVFGGGFPRHDTLPGRLSAQRAIYHIQCELEALVVAERHVAIALCDRGTVDGLAYWPASAGDYWAELGTRHDRELARYQAVVHLETPNLDEGYSRSNPLRKESAKEARAIDRRIADAWAAHPQRLFVASEATFEDKALAALRLVRAQLPPCCHGHRLHAKPGE